MRFNSYAFFVFYLIVLFLYWTLRGNSPRLALLLLGSLFFYGYFHWPCLFLLGGVIVWNYGWSFPIAQGKNPRLCLSISVLGSLTPLLFFKYSLFLAENAAAVLSVVGVSVPAPSGSIFLPLGISFFTFQAIAYQVDLYRGTIPHERSLLRFSLFISFFPQLVAGPIVRGRWLLPEFKEARRFEAAQFHQGLFVLLAGLVLKVGFADILAQFVEPAFREPASQTFSSAWQAVYAFNFQVLADFWGYSTMARGMAYLFGFELPQNFNLPYGSTSLREFWRRWHITMSTWFRDYVFIPLGGSRGGKWRTDCNLLITFFAAGVWHGPAWNFAIWGLWHGVFFLIDQKWGSKARKLTSFLGPANPWLWTLITFHFVCLSTVWFRALSVSDSIVMFQHLLLPPYEPGSWPSLLQVWLLLFLFLHPFLNRWINNFGFVALSLPRQVIITIGLLLFLLANHGATVDFIYFQF